MLHLTDEQIARLFQLCGEIAAVQKELPAVPQGYESRMRVEIAAALRVSLEQHAKAISELGVLLNAPMIELGVLARPENS